MIPGPMRLVRRLSPFGGRLFLPRAPVFGNAGGIRSEAPLVLVKGLSRFRALAGLRWEIGQALGAKH